MKKFLQFMALPLLQALAVLISVVLFAVWNSIGIILMSPILLILHIFLGGYIFSKIEDKKIRVLSALFTALLLIVSYAIIFIVAQNHMDVMYAAIFISPLGNLLPVGKLEYMSGAYMVAETICSVIPVILTVISAKIFSLEKKKIRNILLIVLAVLCAVSLGTSIKSAVEEGNTVSYYDMNGVEYVDNSDIPYYDRNGTVYYWTYDTAKEDDFSYCGELTDERGNKYDIEKVFVDSEGYIFIDENNEITLRDDVPDTVLTGWNYKDKDGRIYTDLLAVEYDSNGKPFTAMGDEYRDK